MIQGYEPAGLTMHPTPRLSNGVLLFSLRCQFLSDPNEMTSKENLIFTLEDPKT